MIRTLMFAMVTLAMGVGLVLVPSAQTGAGASAARAKQGGTFRIIYAGASGIDPALVDTVLAFGAS